MTENGQRRSAGTTCGHMWCYYLSVASKLAICGRRKQGQTYSSKKINVMCWIVRREGLLLARQISGGQKSVTLLISFLSESKANIVRWATHSYEVKTRSVSRAQ